jgi:hypothetical protein
MTSISDLPQVQQLAEKFDLELPHGYRCVATKWFASIEGEKSPPNYHAIVIEEIEVYDTDGNFIKTADLNLLQNSLHNFTCVFTKQK